MLYYITNIMLSTCLHYASETYSECWLVEVYDDSDKHIANIPIAALEESFNLFILY